MGCSHIMAIATRYVSKFDYLFEERKMSKLLIKLTIICLIILKDFPTKFIILGSDRDASLPAAAALSRGMSQQDVRLHGGVLA